MSETTNTENIRGIKITLQSMLKTNDHLMSAIESHTKIFKSLDKKIDNLNQSVDNKINVAVFKKLDVKWQAFGVMVTVMAVILTIHAGAIFLIIGNK